MTAYRQALYSEASIPNVTAILAMAQYWPSSHAINIYNARLSLPVRIFKMKKEFAAE
jgi:hypothetical protein